MKLTEQDKRDSCIYIMNEVCKAVYGDAYKEKDLRFDIQRMPITVREIVDFFIEWLKKRIADEKANQNIVEQAKTEKTS